MKQNIVPKIIINETAEKSDGSIDLDAVYTPHNMEQKKLVRKGEGQQSNQALAARRTQGFASSKGNIADKSKDKARMTQQTEA